MTNEEALCEAVDALHAWAVIGHDGAAEAECVISKLLSQAIKKRVRQQQHRRDVKEILARVSHGSFWKKLVKK